MTVSSQTSNETFNGNGVTTIWDLPFRFFNNADIFVYRVDPITQNVTPLVIGTDYTLTGAGLPEQFGTAPGKITTVVPVANGQDLYVERVMSIEQLTDIINQGKFFPEVHEDVFDRLTMLMQQASATVRGAIRVAIIDPEPTRLPAAAQRANLLMGFDSLGNPIAVSPASGSAAGLALLLANSTFVSQGAAMIGRGIQVVRTIAELRTLLNGTSAKHAFATGYWAEGDGGGGHYYLDAADIVSADNGGSIIVAADGGRWKLVYSGVLRGEQFGMRPSGDAAHAVANTTALLAAIQAMRTNGQLINKGDAGGTMVMCYATGKVTLGNGVFCITHSTLNFTEDHGVVIEGQGSRGASGSNRGNTVLLYKGTSGAFVLRVDGNGARGFQMRGLDLCYDNAGFVGGLVDILTTVGAKFDDVWFGSMVLSGAGTRTSAAWLVRVNEYEMVEFEKCVFHGAAIGLFFDDIAGGSAWLGAGLELDGCWFYDFTDAHIRADGAKVAIGVALRNVAFNPINVAPTRCLNLKNMNGFTMDTCLGDTSVGAVPIVEWYRIVDSYGSIVDSTFGPLAKAATLSGILTLTGNVVTSPVGWTLLNGNIDGSANRFDNCAVAIDLVSGADSLHVDLSNDYFGATVGTSYRCNDASALISGRITYAKSRDLSTNKFVNINDQIEISGEGTKSVAGGTVSLSKADTGMTVFLNAGAVINLPAPVAGVSYNFIKTANGSARVDAAVVGQLYAGDGAAKTSLVATNVADLGPSFSVRAVGSTAWACSSRSAGWTST